MTAMTLITKYPPSIQQRCLLLQACVLNLDVAHIKERSTCDLNAFKLNWPGIQVLGGKQFKPLCASSQKTGCVLISDSQLVLSME